MEKESFLCASTIDVMWALENVRKRIQKEMLMDLEILRILETGF